MKHVILASILTCATAVPCAAQVVGPPLNNGEQYLAVIGPGSGGPCGNAGCLKTNLGVPLTAFATSESVTGQVNALAARTDAQYKQTTSFAAAVGAMRDAIPNDGDRFAVRFNTAAVGSAVGGGVSASANLVERVRASVNYGYSRGENVVSGGLNFSFH